MNAAENPFHLPQNQPAQSPSQKNRWDPKDRTAVTVIEDEVFYERLDKLREMSSRLNKLLQQKLDQLPNSPYYSWNKSAKADAKQGDALPKILHIAVLFRPEFFHSAERKNEQTRYNTDDDQLTIFLHLRPDNTIQETRAHRGYSQSAYGLYFMHAVLALFEKERKDIEEALSRDDLEGIASRVTEYFSANSKHIKDGDDGYLQETTVFFQKAYELNTLSEAASYFSEKKNFLYQTSEVIRNLGKAALVSVLEASLKDCLASGMQLVKIRETLHLQAEKVFDLVVPVYPDPASLGSFIPKNKDYATQTIQVLIKKYKPQILGWNKPAQKQE